MKNPVIRYFEGWARRYNRDMGQFLYKAPDMIFQKTMTFLPQSGPIRLLDAGIGTGLSSLPFRNAYRDRIDITGVDASPSMLSGGHVADQTVQCDIDGASLPFSSQSFDIVVCAGVAEYIQNLPFLLQELARVLKDGGILALTHEPPQSLPNYRRGIWSGVLLEAPEGVVLQRRNPRSLWPQTYRKFLFADGFVDAQLDAAGFHLIDQITFDCYQWSTREAIPHRLVVARKAAGQPSL